MTPAGRTPVTVVCPEHGLLWTSVDSGASFTQPAASLVAKHPGAVVSAMLRSRQGGAVVRFRMGAEA